MTAVWVKRLVLASVLALVSSIGWAQGVGPPNQIFCNKVATVAVGSSSIQTLVPAQSNKSVFICGWHVTNTGAAGTFTLTYGTQTTNPCDTGNGTILPLLNVTSSAPSSDHNGTAYTQAPIGAAVCVTTSVATMATVLFYAQQ